MGQRLVVTIQHEGRDIAAIYYHWSAYTYSALLETQNVIRYIYNHEDETEKDLLLRLIHFCESNGGGIRGDMSEFKYIQSIYPQEKFKEDGYSRNNGLIALSENGIKDLQGWSEGDVYIDIDNERVNFGVYTGWISLNEYINERKEWDDELDESEFSDIPYIDCELGYFDVDEIDYIIKQFKEKVKNNYVIQCKSEICELVE